MFYCLQLRHPESFHLCKSRGEKGWQVELYEFVLPYSDLESSVIETFFDCFQKLIF